MFFIGTVRAWLREASRKIFQYHDGLQWKRADPIWIGGRLETVCPEYQDLLELLRSDLNEVPVGPLREDVIRQKKEASLKLATAARNIFGLYPLSETGKGGVTDGEAISVLTQYFVFMEEIARETELFRASSGVESASPPT